MWMREGQSQFGKKKINIINWKVCFIFFIIRRVQSIPTGPEIILHWGLSDTEWLQGGTVPDCGQADSGVPVQQEEEGGEFSTGDWHSASGNLSDLSFPSQNLSLQRNHLSTKLPTTLTWPNLRLKLKISSTRTPLMITFQWSVSTKLSPRWKAEMTSLDWIFCLRRRGCLMVRTWRRNCPQPSGETRRFKVETSLPRERSKPWWLDICWALLLIWGNLSLTSSLL